MLTRGAPVGIDIFNHLYEATTVHWHGIEIQEPYYDGPVGFLSASKLTGPMIAPGGTFEAHFTPTRAGTFIYHSHMDDVWQVAGGLAGPLIVLEPGTTFDPTSDHIVILTTPNDAKYWGARIDVNGTVEPQPIDMVPGAPQMTWRLPPHAGHYTLEILPDANSPAYAKIPIDLVGRVARN